ncbi:SMC-Scp complex subunit ScpB [Nocardia sp. NPDC059240]|uniref:SMC-Scp complex subunit ScpB n=1 Tax=Nocardia sp. NPDC059240 TaxID=3346786 RepID=UPI0036C32919
MASAESVAAKDAEVHVDAETSVDLEVPADAQEVVVADVPADAEAPVDAGTPAVARVDVADVSARGGGDAELYEDDEELTEEEFRAALEAMLLVVDAPAPVELLASAMRAHPIRVETALREMSGELTARRSGMDLRFVGDGWRYYTRQEFAPYVERMLLDGARSKLTRAALETMAVIAYRQPVTRARVSAVRGVNVDGVIRTLLARGLIAEAGADPETNGTLYITTELFLERIGLASLADLPPLAPLLPGVDLIDEINESLDTDPRYTRLKKPAVADIDLGTDD